MTPTIRIALARLTSDQYDVPKGTLGYVRDRAGENAFAMQWVDNPGPGGVTAPVLAIDLEEMGMLTIVIPAEGSNPLVRADRTASASW
jgi:hypothetical protein